MPTFTMPVISIGSVYQTYINAARTNLENLLKLSTGLADAEFTVEAQGMLDNFNEVAADALALIAEDSATGRFDPAEAFWRESVYAERAGLAQ